MPPRVAAVAPGPPFAPGTFSGISAGLLGALRDRGALVGAVDGRPGWLERVEQAASFHPDRARWQQWYNAGASPLSPLVRRGMSATATRRVGAFTEEADAVLQLTGWYRPAAPGRLRASFHDGNLATFLERPDLRIDRGSRRVRRALAWERALYDETDVILPMSEWLGRAFVEVFEQPREKVVAVGAGPSFDALPEVPDRRWDEPVYLFVGKDWERKGGGRLARAWPAVRAARPGASLVVVGPIDVPGDLPAGAEFLGRIDRSDPAGEAALQAAYGRATAFLMPSLYEPFGIAFLEAMAYGLPCLATDRCAMPEIVSDGLTGRIADPDDADALAEALIELGDPERARAMGAAGRRRVEEHFTWDAVAGRVLAAIGARAGA